MSHGISADHHRITRRLGIIMYGLGPTLTVGDFARVGKHPKAVFITLACQLILLPAACFGLVLAFHLPPVLAVVMMLVAVIAGAVYSNLDILVANFGALALITVLFCLVSLSVGYWVPQWFGVKRAQAVASGFEIGIHNATLAIVIAQTVLGSVELSLPAAVYGVLMFFIAAAFGFVIRGKIAGNAVAETAQPAE